jgi:hypothetical protein
VSFSCFLSFASDGLVAEKIDLVDPDLGALIDIERQDLGVLYGRVMGLRGSDMRILVTLLGIEFLDRLDSHRFMFSVTTRPLIRPVLVVRSSASPFSPP